MKLTAEQKRQQLIEKNELLKNCPKEQAKMMKKLLKLGLL